jgi:hypothetical protein
MKFHVPVFCDYVRCSQIDDQHDREHSYATGGSGASPRPEMSTDISRADQPAYVDAKAAMRA